MPSGDETQHATGAQRTSKDPEERKADIVNAARELFEQKGMNHTSIKDITEKVGVTRGLFYYYFPDKDAVIDAVIGQYVDEFAKNVKAWDESRTFGDVEGAVRSCAKLIRRALIDAGMFKRNIALVENSDIYNRFVKRAIDEIVETIERTTVRDYADYHTIEIDYVYETFYMLIYGLSGLVKAQPDVSDEVIVALIEQTLHLDIKR